MRTRGLGHPNGEQNLCVKETTALRALFVQGAARSEPCHLPEQRAWTCTCVLVCHPAQLCRGRRFCLAAEMSCWGALSP